ncbi:MAG: hypothetical protein KTR32_08185 [Granulosicoccus sp.]|nr:hypothetical protein [Granulosicoccus sp.]
MLIVSLVILIAMTVLGVSTMSGTRLSEKITSNSQQKSIAFEVAESGIRSVWDVAYLRQQIATSLSAGNNPSAVAIADADTGLQSQFDQLDTSGKGADIGGSLTVQYCGEIMPIGSGTSEDLSSTQIVSMLIDINSMIDIGNSNTTADHLQRTRITNLRTRRTASCSTR